ncbi:DcaP family trimeric outer membrane transporter [uncultured Parasphingorhabdus sp.]|uniref:DcaP family trimeric outer membrane transporter n=1 Tax=uncultured Parasphingorhabdus sp. TaxID=2709694 RepID=UPI0030D82113|tara:strand:+ start:20734 stop:22116 length:1383 start_codon:yes stop_codon:yes gene_type:complete
MAKAARFLIKGLLLSATMLSASAASAQKSDVHARLDRLEALVTGLIDRMDAKEGGPAASDVAVAEQARQAISETRALAERTAAVETKVAEQASDANVFNVGNTRVTYGGYVKIDAISQRTSGGQVGTGSIVRDFLIPGAIPVGGTASGIDTDFSARQSRFILETSTDVGEGHKLGSKIEMDFMVTSDGDERVSNSYTPRLRQAYITFDNWLFGQAWSTFQDVGALPEALDFIGPTPGTVFNRQPMVRYTNGGLQIAIEQPETTVTSPTGGRVVAGDDSLPDVVLRYNHSGDFGHLTAAAIGRVLRVKPDDFGLISDSAIGYGLSLSGKVNMGSRDDVRFMATAGQGLGRYIGLNIVNDAALRVDGSLDPITTYSGFLAYRHIWTDKLRSTISGSYFKADNPVVLTTGVVTDQSWNAFANIIYSPVPPLDLGIEYMYADRELENGLAGNLQKLQVSAKYKF